MNLTLKQRLWRLKGLADAAKDVPQSYSLERLDMTIKSQLPWGEKVFLRIAAASVSIAMHLRQKRISNRSQRQKEITAYMAELKRLAGLRVHAIQNGKEKSMDKWLSDNEKATPLDI